MRRRSGPRAARAAVVPVTQVPSGKTKDHQVSANGSAMRARADRQCQRQGRPRQCECPDRNAVPEPEGVKCGGVPRRQSLMCGGAQQIAAVMDCPSGPSTIHTVGTRAGVKGPGSAKPARHRTVTQAEASRLAGEHRVAAEQHGEPGRPWRRMRDEQRSGRRRNHRRHDGHQPAAEGVRRAGCVG